jgi:hypothetical protein
MPGFENFRRPGSDRPCMPAVLALAGNSKPVG